MATKKKGVLTGPDPDDLIVHEMIRKDYSKMSPADKAKFDRADAAMKQRSAANGRKPATRKR